MGKTVDERVVEMKFDNAQFEKNVQTSISTLDKLKSALKLDGIGKGLEEIDKSAKKIDMSPLSHGVETVQTKFSALQVMAVTALANITNSAIEAGKNLVNGFAIQPIKDGFAEYELLMDSVKTIKASTGESVETINKYLDELNTYADKTIYTFSDMTQNIGKFTNAGVQLDSAVKAIKGISNEAAVSGANANEASRAMYNFAQALSAGYVKLIDWKSIENANMATVEFKQSLIDTAVAMGTVVKKGDDYITTTTNAQGKVSDAFNATKGFNDALQNQWMTSEVLVQTLEQYSTDVRDLSEAEKKEYEAKLKGLGYTDDQIKSIEELGIKAADAATKITKFTQLLDVTKEAVGSGWAQTFRLIFGDFEEAQDLWTAVGNAVTGYVDKTSDARNETIRIWKILGGRDALITAFENVAAAIKSVLNPIKEAFDQVFPPVAPRHIVALTKELAELTSNLKISGATAENIKRTFSGVFSVFHIAGSAIAAVVKAIFPMASSLSNAGASLFDFTAKIGDWLTALDKSLTETNYFENAISNFSQSIKNAIENVKNFANGVVQTFTKFNSVGEVFNYVKDKIQEVIDKIKEFFSTKIEAPDTSALDLFANKFKERFKPLTVVGELIGKIFSGIGKIVSSFSPVIVKAFDAIINAVVNLANALLKALDSGGFRAFFDVINAGLLAGMGVGLSKFVKNLTGLGDTLGETIEGFGGLGKSITGTFDQLTGCLKTLQGSIKADILQKIAISVGILAAALVALSLIDSDKLTAPLAALTGLLIELIGAMKVMTTLLSSDKSGFLGGIENALNSFALSNMGGAIEKLAISMLILAGAMKILSALDVNQLAIGLTAIGGSLAIFVATFRLMPDDKKIGGAAAAIMVLSTAMVILSGALKIMGSMDVKQLAISLGAMGGSLAIMVIAFRTMPEQGMVKSASAIFIMATAMTILGGALKIMGSLDVNQLATALTALGGSLLVVVLAFRTMPEQGVLKSAAAMLVMATAMTILGGALKIMGSLDVNQLAIALGALAGSLLIMILSLGALSAIGAGVLIGAGALLIMSEALVVLGGALKIMGSLDVNQLAIALGALAGSLIIMVTALGVLSAVGGGALIGAAALLTLSVALIALGSALKIFASMKLSEIGIGLLGMAGALTVLLAAGAVASVVAPGLFILSAALLAIGVAAIACGAGVTMLAAGLASLAVSGLAGATALVGVIKVLVVGLLNVIADSAVALKEAVVAVIISCLEAFVETKTAFVECVLQLVETVLTSLANHAPTIVDKLMDFIIGVLDTLTSRLPELAESIGKFLKKAVDLIISGINNLDVTKLQNMVIFGSIASGFFLSLASLAGLAGPAMLGVLAFGALVVELTGVLTAIGAINKIPGLKEFVDSGGDLLQSVGTAIGKFLGGFIGGALEGVAAQLPKIGADLSQFMMAVMPFLAEANMINPSILVGVGALTGAILLLTGASLVQGIASFFSGGGSNIARMGQELANFAPYMLQFYETIKNVKPDVIEASANAALALAEMASKLPNSGGLAGKIFGENSLAQFGEELEKFGPHIKKYGDDVANLNAEAVQASASAAQIMADMASTLPNSGGLSGKIFGENTLSAFGEELASFGPHIKQYGEDVDGLDAAAVEASASATQIMADMAATLPNSGGLAGKIFGDNTLSAFGEELEKFGPHIKQYSEDVSGLDPAAVEASASAAQMMSDLANKLPDSGGLKAVIFGDNTLSQFGAELAKFGKLIADYSLAVADANLVAMNGAITEIQKLVALANDIAAIDTSVYSNFAQSLETMAKNGIGNFANAFINSSSQVQAAVNTLISNTTSAINALLPNLMQTGTIAGQQIDTGLINGMNNFAGNVISTATKVCTDLINVFKKEIVQIIWFNLAQIQIMQAMINGLQSKRALLMSTINSICLQVIQTFRTVLQPNIFYNFGSETIMQSLINGITNKREPLMKLVRDICKELIGIFEEELKPENFVAIGESILQGLIDGLSNDAAKEKLNQAVKTLCELIIKTFKSYTEGDNNEFYKVGVYIDEGLAKGIIDSKGKVIDAVKKVVEEAVKAAKKSSDENSPSKVFAQIGRYFDLGLVQGINAEADSVSEATSNLSKSAIETMRDAIARVSEMTSDELTYQPTITPVLDLTNIQNGSRKLRGLVTRGLNTSIVYSNALSASPNSKLSAISNEDNKASTVSNSYNFTQNNYSPKALSRKEIYRQTKNQFAAMKGAVNAV